MAFTAISDLVVPEVFAPYIMQQALDKNALIQSGFVTNSGVLSARLAGGGSIFTFPSLKSIDEDNTLANASTDASASPAVPEKLSAEEENVCRLERNKHFSGADLAATLAGVDPLAQLGGTIGRAVNQWRQRTLMAQIAGIANETRLASSINTVASESISGAGAGTKFSTGALIDTLTVWGDKSMDSPVALAMHSDVYRMLVKADLISNAPTSTQNLGFGTYLGFSVLVDDRIGKRAGTTDGLVYTLYMIKAGAIEMGVGSARVPVAVSRDELAADGGGIEQIAFRDQFCYHVVGSNYNVSTNNPSDTVLSTAASWSIVYPAKHIGVAALVCNL